MEKITSLGVSGFMAITTFIVPIQFVLLAVGMFIFADTIIGVWKAKKLNILITSRRLADVIKKMLIYQLATITFYCVDYAIINDIVHSMISIEYALTKLLALVLISIEAYSIDESFKLATGKGLFERMADLIKKYKTVKNRAVDYKSDKTK
jgi:hypothetical protein